MSKSDSISMSVIRRLPRYYRFLSELDEQRVERISSNKLAQIMNVTASQVRQDLNCFGGFGQQGYGYSVSQLKNEIRHILGLDNSYKAILIGAGNFGTAVSNHLDFNKLGFELVGGFETDRTKFGEMLGVALVPPSVGVGKKPYSLYVGTGVACLFASGNNYTIGVSNTIKPDKTGNTLHVTGHNVGHKYAVPCIPATLTLEYEFLPQVAVRLSGGYRFVLAGGQALSPKGQFYATVGICFQLWKIKL